jgi:hypothetical protein
MTPKDKAKELVDKFQRQIFYQVTDEKIDILEAKGCALIAVNVGLTKFSKQFWQQVKKEINLL